MRSTLAFISVAALALAVSTKAQKVDTDKEVVLVDPVNTNDGNPSRPRPETPEGGGGVFTGILIPSFGPGFPFGRRPGGPGIVLDAGVQGQTPGRAFITDLLKSIFGGRDSGFQPGYFDEVEGPDTSDYFYDFTSGPGSSSSSSSNDTRSDSKPQSGCGLLCLLSPGFARPFNGGFGSPFGGGFGSPFGGLPEGAEPEVVFEEKVLPDGTVVRSNKTSYASDDGTFHIIFHSTSVNKQGGTDGEDNEVDVEVDFPVQTPKEEDEDEDEEDLPEVSHREKDTTTSTTTSTTTATATSTTTSTTTTQGSAVGVDAGLNN